MLIVNADDWGLRPEVTDSILECWRAGAVTAASAMTGMLDSERAFGLAREGGPPLGLHVNLTTPLTAAGVPADERRRQQRAVEYFAAAGWRRYALDPLARSVLDRCVADQLAAFAAGSGQAAAHADGHQHVQSCPTVLCGCSLGAVRTLRRAHGFVPGQRSSPKRAYRGTVNWLIRRRFRSAAFVSLRDLHPALGGVGLDGLARLAGRGEVEVMTHPAWEDEREVLLSSSWRSFVAGLPTGSHADLA